uniref:lipopolysaccharide biosynthesis protein n=1 Tax=Phocaeicola vulgatus TaxID=821 RepID=UPI0040268B91
MRKKTILKNISYSFFANGISLLISVFMVLIVPKFISVYDYGIWQLFLFYFTYLGFFPFGLVDGIYLRFAGKKFGELDTKLFAGQYYFLLTWLIFISVLLLMLVNEFISDSVKKMVLICCILLIPAVNFHNLSSFIMQITNRIKNYAELVLLERISLASVVFLFITLGYRHFINMYYAKAISILLVCGTEIYLCRRLLKPDFYPLKEILVEVKESCTVGIKLLFANVASMLIIGIIRFGISEGWDVATFGKVSLTLSISSFLMVCIDSISVVFFPILKHIELSKLPDLYRKLRTGIDFVGFTFLLGYYPAYLILCLWLPQYKDSLAYMAILFPICIFECKISLLINTYLKSLRKEYQIFKINLSSLVISGIITYLVVNFIHNLTTAVISITVIYALRCIISELSISKILGLNLTNGILMDIFMVSSFMILGSLLRNLWGMLIYTVIWMLYLYISKEKILDFYHLIRE